MWIQQSDEWSPRMSVIKADEEQREIAPAGSDEGDVKAADWL